VRRLLSLDLLDDRYPALHGVRVLAIVSVVQYHVTTILTYEARLPIDVSYGTLSMSVFFGMDLFFVLSGFLIGSILLRSLDTTGLVHVGRFWLRRAFRILPLYYVVLAVLALTLDLTASQKQHLPWEVHLLHIPLCRRVVAPMARWLANERGWPMELVWPVSLGALLVTALAAAYACHLLVEKPSLWVRDRIVA
jgi:peptidoglycan/LPS O-acetylase OafA/YrhL